jgi:porphobilinogen deaminase
MGGGCLSPVAAHATQNKGAIFIRGVALKENGLARAEEKGAVAQAESIGLALAKNLA